MQNKSLIKYKKNLVHHFFFKNLFFFFFKIYLFFLKWTQFKIINSIFINFFFFNKNQYIYLYIFFKKYYLFFKRYYNVFVSLTLYNIRYLSFNEDIKKNKEIIYKKKNIDYYKYNVFLKKFTNKYNFLFFSNKIFDLKRRMFKIILENRTLLKKIFKFLFIRSKKLNYIIYYLSHKKNRNLLNFFEYKLYNILLLSGLTNTWLDGIYLITYKKILVNNTIIPNINYICSPNSIVSIAYHRNYYYYHKFSLYLNKKILNKFKYRKFKYINKSKYRNIKKTWYLNSYIYKNAFRRIKIPSYLEIDYSILTLIFINIYKYNVFYNIIWKKLLSIYMFKHYNWKYIS